MTVQLFLDHEQRIRECTIALNLAIRAAAKDGLRVSLGQNKDTLGYHGPAVPHIILSRRLDDVQYCIGPTDPPDVIPAAAGILDACEKRLAEPTKRQSLRKGHRQ